MFTSDTQPPPQHLALCACERVCAHARTHTRACKRILRFHLQNHLPSLGNTLHRMHDPVTIFSPNTWLWQIMLGPTFPTCYHLITSVCPRFMPYLLHKCVCVGGDNVEDGLHCFLPSLSLYTQPASWLNLKLITSSFKEHWVRAVWEVRLPRDVPQAVALVIRTEFTYPSP